MARLLRRSLLRGPDALMRGKSRRQGFSLIEVMIALGVLAFGLLGLMLIMGEAVQQGSKGRHTSAAASIARDQYEQMLRMAFSDPNLAVTAGWIAPPWIANAGFAAGEVPAQTTTPDGTVNTEHVYLVEYQVAADAGGNPDLRNIELRVTWNEDGEQNAKTVSLAGMLVDNDR
jgi:type IV pilus assembly protein PilV